MVSPPNPSNQAVQQDHIVILNRSCVLPSVQGIFLPLASKTKTLEVFGAFDLCLDFGHAWCVPCKTH